MNTLLTSALPVLVLTAIISFTAPASAAKADTFMLPDSSKIEVFLALPPSTIQSDKGLVLCLGGGPANRSQAESALNYFKGLVERGWTAASPVSPDGKPLFGENGRKMPQLIQLLQKRPGIPHGKVLLAGQSNGGIAAFEIAALIPQQILGVIALPGVLSPATDLDQLQGLPVFLRLGAKDELNWGNHYPSVVKHLTQAQVKLDAKLLPTAGHGVPLAWDELDPWLATLLPKPAPAAAPKP